MGLNRARAWVKINNAIADGRLPAVRRADVMGRGQGAADLRRRRRLGPDRGIMNGTNQIELLRADGTAEALSDCDLMTLQAAVGGWVEELALPYGDALYVNEEGLCLGLPANAAASGMYGRAVVGDAVVVRRSLMN